MNQKLLALYGLKWNPFSPELPVEAIYVPPKLENFCWPPSTPVATRSSRAWDISWPAAGNASLMTPQLRHTLCDHAAGNYRILPTMAAELLTAAA